MKMAFTNARLMDPATGMDELGSLVIDGNIIEDAGASAPIEGAGEVVDCGGRVLCPGFIDMRAHAVDSKSALAGGITTIILQPNQTSVIDNDAMVERIRHRSIDSQVVSVYPMGAATQGMQGSQIAEIGQMQQSGAVAFTDCTKAVANAQVMRRLLEYAKHFDALVVQYAENPELADGAIAHEGEIATRLGLVGSPAAAEAMQIDQDVSLAKLTGARLHFALISSKQGVEAVKRAKQAGIKVSCSTAPHYLHLNDNALEGYRTFAKVQPPLRSEEDRLALIEGLADGTIDTLVSDHMPKSADVKRLPFAQAAPGVVGFETLLALALAPVHRGQVELMTLLKSLSSKPAELLGLPTGNLKPGSFADFAIFDPNKPWRIEEDKLLSDAKNTPFDTLPVQGQVWKTIADGMVVFERD